MTVRASAAIVVTHGAPCRRDRGAVPYVSARRLTAAGRRIRPPRRSQSARPRPSDELGDLRDRRTGRGRAELPLQDDQIGPGRYTGPGMAWMAGAQPPALLPVSVQRRVELTAVDGTGQVLNRWLPFGAGGGAGTTVSGRLSVADPSLGRDRRA